MANVSRAGQRRRVFFVVAGLAALVVVCALLAGKAIRLEGRHFTFSPWSQGWVMPGLVKQAAMAPEFETVCEFEVEVEVGPGTKQPLKVAYETLADTSAMRVSGVDVELGPGTRRRVALPTLHQGKQTLTMTLMRKRGVPALACRVEDATGRVMTQSDGPGWVYRINGSVPALPRRVREPWIGDGSDPLELQQEVVWGFGAGTGAVALVGMGLAAAGVWLARRRGKNAEMSAKQYWLLTAGTIAVWSVMLVWVWCHMNAKRGFDLAGHMQYVGYVLEHGTVPVASQGWQMYQAPLYYFLAAGALYVTGTSIDAPLALTLLHGLNLVLAILFLLATAGALKNFAGRRVDHAAGAFLLVACCPVSFYLFCYITNENLATVTTAGVFWALSRLHTRQATSLACATGLGLMLGLAFLSKVSTLLLLAPVAVFYGMKLLAWRPQSGLEGALRQARSRARLVAAGLMMAGVCAGAAGWYYGYLWVKLGAPVVGNWDAASGQRWWQMPGVRSLNDYLPSLAAYHAPIYAGFEDVWSGFWSTMAGDALLGGSTRMDVRPGFNDWVFPVTLTTTLVFLVLGVIGVLRSARVMQGRMRRGDLVLLSSACAACFALIYMTLVVPSYAQAKSFYAMSLILPVAFFAGGMLRLTGRKLHVTTVLALAGPWIAGFVAMFAVVPGTQMQSFDAVQSLFAKPVDEVRSIEALKAVLERDPNVWPVRLALARVLVTYPGQGSQVGELIDVQGLDKNEGPCVAARLFIKAQLLASANQPNEAVRTMSLAIAANPALVEPWVGQVQWLSQMGLRDQAQNVAKAGLVFHPWSAELLAAARG